jgi:hypothetical protein
MNRTSEGLRLLRALAGLRQRRERERVTIDLERLAATIGEPRYRYRWRRPAARTIFDKRRMH